MEGGGEWVCLAVNQGIDSALFFLKHQNLPHILPHSEITTLELYWGLRFVGVFAAA